MSFSGKNNKIKKGIYWLLNNVSFSRGDKFLFFFMLTLPVINALADSTIYYFVEPDKESGMHPGIIRGIILIIFIFLFGFKRIKNERPSPYIIVFLAYLFILTLFSSDIRYSFMSGYIKWFIPLMMYPVGMYFIRRIDSLALLIKIYIFGAMIVCINLLIAQFTGYGISAYVEKSFYTGGAGVGITNQLALVILTYPFVLRQRGKMRMAGRLFIYTVGLLSIVFIFLAMKRAAIISLLSGSVIFVYNTQSKVRFIRYFAIIVLAGYLVFPVFKDIITERYNARMKQMENIEKEARYQEFFFVLKEFKEGNIGQKLFGKELFNSGAHFGMKYFHTPRMIHSDMSGFLYGSGITGIMLYLSIYYFLFMEGLKYSRHLRKDGTYRELFAIYFAILFATFLVSATGSGTIGERCLVFMLLGAVAGLTREKMKSEVINKKQINGSIPPDIRQGKEI